MELLLAEILDDACPNGNPGEYGPEWNAYWIETHCVGFNIIARKVEGEWKILKWDSVEV